MLLAVWLLASLLVAPAAAQNSTKPRYSSFECIGGSQVLDSNSLKQASVTVFPLNDPAHRTCLFRNVCFKEGKFMYYSKYNAQTKPAVPLDYTPEGFAGNVFHVAYLRGFTLPVNTVHESVPANIPFSDALTFLDANSWSFNYGHYLIDNVLPAFMAASIFNLPFAGSQQLFETNCRKFSILEEAFSERIVTYNRSMGTYRQACLTKLDGMNGHFFDLPPQYVDKLQESKQSVCFKRLMAGHGSTFGLKSVDLSRAFFLRQFRDFVLQRVAGGGVVLPPQEDLVLIGLRTVGAAGGSVVHDLCGSARDALKRLPQYASFRVECFVPSDLTFEEEIRQVQRAKVLVSVHGTISYMALFTRDGTQQISVASPKELKENQILLYATHVNTLYLTWNRLDELPGLLLHALSLSDAFHQA